jgi:transcriptional regulator GlxA family with amidase domain
VEAVLETTPRERLAVEELAAVVLVASRLLRHLVPFKPAVAVAVLECLIRVRLAQAVLALSS